MQLNCVALLGSSYFLQPGPLFELQTGPTDYLVLLELQVWAQANAAATQLVALGLGIPAARGVGVLPAAPQPEDGGTLNTAAGTQLYTAWSTLPTIPANFLRRRSMSLVTAAQGVPDFWRFRSGLKILPSSSFVFWLITSGYTVGIGQGQIDVTLIMDD